MTGWEDEVIILSLSALFIINKKYKTQTVLHANSLVVLGHKFRKQQQKRPCVTLLNFLRNKNMDMQKVPVIDRMFM